MLPRAQGLLEDRTGPGSKAGATFPLPCYSHSVNVLLMTMHQYSKSGNIWILFNFNFYNFSESIKVKTLYYRKLKKGKENNKFSNIIGKITFNILVSVLPTFIRYYIHFNIKLISHYSSKCVSLFYKY